MGGRRRGRILAFQAVYAWGAASSKEKPALLEDLLSFPWLDDDKKKALGDTADFSRLLIQGTLEKISDIDTMIKGHLKNWDFSRLNRVDLALLRISVYALMFQDIPPTVIIDEAVAISRDYGTDDSYRFVNGVLDSVRQTIGKENEVKNGRAK
jgi:N utilization substance protein B